MNITLSRISQSPSYLRQFTRFSFLRVIAIALFGALMTGCAATVYKVDPELVQNFQEPEVPADKTGVYVIRGSNFQGGARGLWVAVDDAVVADLSNGSHVYLELDAGLNTLHFVQATAGFGYMAIDNKPGEIVYAKFGYATTGLTEILDEDLGKSTVMKTRAVEPLTEKRENTAYDNLVINPGTLAYPIMTNATEELNADSDHAVVRFYRPSKLISGIAFDVWSQEGYVGSTKGGAYFSVKLKPGHYDFLARSERYAILSADLEAGKEYAAELTVGMGWNQAHIKLLPIDLNSDAGRSQVTGWKASLSSTVVDPAVVASKPIAKRIDTGSKYLSNRTINADNTEPKRDLPSNFGQ